MVVAGCRQNLNDIVADLDDGHVERTSAQIVNHDFLCFPVVKAVGKSGAGRLVDDTLHIEACNPSRVLRRLPLHIIKIGRDSDDCSSHCLTQILFRILLQLHQNHGADGLRLIILPVNADAPVRTHLSFDGTYGTVRIGGRLPPCHIAYQSFSLFSKCNDTGSSSCTGTVRHDDRLSVFHHSHTTVGGSQVDSDYSAHLHSSIYHLQISIGSTDSRTAAS